MDVQKLEAKVQALHRGPDGVGPEAPLIDVRKPITLPSTGSIAEAMPHNRCAHTSRTGWSEPLASSSA